MDVLDFCCGAGVYSTGFASSGHKIRYGIDAWDGCQSTFEHNHPDAKFVLSDVRNLDPRDFSDVDIVIGSPPCQHFSIAKYNRDPCKGMELVLEFLRWIDEIRPKWWIMENVEGIEMWLRRHCASRVPKIATLNAVNYGTPQKRTRCFAGNFVVPEPTHSRVKQRSINEFFDNGSPNTMDEWLTVRDAIGDIMFLDADNDIPNHDNIEWLPMSAQKNIKYMKLHKALVLDKPSRTILADGGKNIIHAHIRIEIGGKYRALTVRELARIQGIPDSFEFRGTKTANYTMVGNAVPVQLSVAIGSELSTSR